VLEHLRQGTFWFKFVAFVAYSSEDDDVVLNHLYPELTAKMSKITDVNMTDLITIGDFHFRPGFTVNAEGHRALTESGVVLAVISRAFCASAYCKDELEQAHSLKRPIVLIFIEEVDEHDMGEIVHHLFKSKVRVQYRREGDQSVIKPDWSIVCTSVLQLIPDT